MWVIMEKRITRSVFSEPSQCRVKQVKEYRGDFMIGWSGTVNGKEQKIANFTVGFMPDEVWKEAADVESR